MPAAAGTIIKVDNVSFDYRSGEHVSRGVRNVSLTVNRGEFVVLLGHNGSGKSTLAKLLNGFVVPDEGTVTVEGIDTRDNDRIYELRAKVGMVFQNADNQMVASVIENDIAFGPENLGVPREDIEKRITWALDAVNMSEHRKRSPNKLSGGQKQRIAIAAILAMYPEVLILDESTAMLDPKGRAEIMDTILRLNKEIGADRIFVMNEGSVLLEGTPREVFSATDKISEAKLELPVASKISAELRRAGLDVPFALTDEELAEGLCRLK